MPWIEGIGDEVTIFFSVVFLLSILIAAWFSTGIRDIPFISVIIVQLTRRRRLNQEQSQSSNVEQADAISEGNQDTITGTEEDRTVPQAAGSDNSDHDEVVEEEVDTIGDQVQVQPNTSQTNDSSRERATEQSPGTDVSTDDVESVESSENLTSDELRKRRLEFLSGKAQACDIHNQTGSEVNTDETCDNPLSLNQTEVVHRTNSQVKQTATASNSSNGTDSQTPGATKQSADVASNETGDVEENGAIQVKIKFLNDTHRQVDANLNETIGSFRRRNFSEEISESKLVRFIYNGQDLRNDSSTLQNYNIGNNSVLHCLITQPQQEEHPNIANNEENGLDIGILMFPLFGLLLSIVWYLRFTYRQIFNVTSTLTLGGITFLYVAAFLSSFRAHRVHEHVD